MEALAVFILVKSFKVLIIFIAFLNSALLLFFQVEQNRVKLLNDQAVAKSQLQKKLGQFLYLTNLEKVIYMSKTMKHITYSAGHSGPRLPALISLLLTVFSAVPGQVYWRTEPRAMSHLCSAPGTGGEYRASHTNCRMNYIAGFNI